MRDEELHPVHRAAELCDMNPGTLSCWVYKGLVPHHVDGEKHNGRQIKKVKLADVRLVLASRSSSWGGYTRKTKDVMTTGQVSAICRVAPRTVSKWIDGGKLKGYRIPGSNDRRVLRTDLVRFLVQHGMPTRGLQGDGVTLLIGTDARLHEAVTAAGGYAVHADTIWQGVMGAMKRSPNCIIVDTAVGRTEAMRAGKQFASEPTFQHCRLFVLTGEDDPEHDAWMEAGYCRVFRKPYDIAAVLGEVNRPAPAPSA